MADEDKAEQTAAENPPAGDGEKPKAEAKGKRRGNRSKWQGERSVEIARQLARQGCTNAQIAEALGYSATYFYEVIRLHPELAEALKESKQEVDLRVEGALYRRALGYTYEETREVVELDVKKNVPRVVRREKVTKTVLPDTTAQIFYLKNRLPDRWRDSSRYEHTGKDGGPIEHRELSGYSDDELKAIAEGAKPR